MSRANRVAAAQQVAERLWATEVAIDNALAEAAALAGFMPIARMEAGMAAEVGHDAIVHANAAMNILTAARGRILDAHRVLADVQKVMRIGQITATGAWGEKPATGSLATLANDAA